MPDIFFLLKPISSLTAIGPFTTSISDLQLLSHINTQHWTAESVSQCTCLIFFPFLSLMRRWPQLGPIRIIRIVKIAFTLAIKRGVYCLSIHIAVIGTASMSEVRAKYENVACNGD